jgi:hypothetical protein
MASGPRKFYDLTFNEFGTSDTVLSAALRGLLTGNEEPLTSLAIWHKLVPDSHYHVFTEDKEVYVANLVGEVKDGSIQFQKIYKHKPMKLTRFTQNDETALHTEINDYFLLANRTESSPQDPAFRLDKIFDLRGSHVAVYTNGAIDILYSAPSNVFVDTHTTPSTSQSSSTSSATVPGQITNSVMVPSPSPGPSTSSAVIAVTPQQVVQQVVQQIDGQGAQQIAEQVARQVAQQLAQQLAQSNGGPNKNDGKNENKGTPVPTFSTSNTALSCAEVTAQYNVSGKDKVECVSSTGATPVSSVTLVLDAKQVTLPTVGLEKKDGKWVGFASVGAAQWVWVEITGKKMKYKVQFKSQDWDAKEVEVKDEKDKKLKFEGGTVEYSGQNPFDTGSVVTTVLIVVISIAVAIGILAAVIVVARLRRYRS